ncbi:MAG: DUF115 domain-containing protein [Spirochaetales bacterium]|nr:DUF115 domain-containing protein [Spirochaetales bacterium]
MDSGGPVLIDTGSGYTIQYRGVFLYSSLEPENVVERKVRRLSLREKTLFFIPSPGLGYGLTTFLERLPPSSHILCVEIDEQLFSIAQQKQRAVPHDTRLTIVRTGNIGELLNYIKTIGIFKFRRAEMCTLTRGFHLYKEQYQNMFRHIEQEIQRYWKNKMTFIHMAPLWIKNMFLNLSLLETCSDINTIATDLPVIVTGAGPSLEESTGEIKKLRKKVILVTVDTAFPCLYEQGILPDFIFMLESQVANLQDFVICRDPGVPLICDITSHPGVIRLFKKKKYLFASRFSEIRLLERLNRAGFLPTEFPALGSVGVAAVYAALHLTRGPVLLAGLDFGYTKHMTHCKGTAFYRLLERISTRLLPLEHLVYKSIMARPLIRQKGKQGKTVLTDLILSSYAGQIPHIAGERDGIFDIGNDGLDLGLPGIEIMNVSEKIQEKGLYKNAGYEKESGYRLPQAGEVETFLLKEKEYLSECKKLIMPLVKGRNSIKAELPEKEHKALLDVDYTYLHFPDQASLPTSEQSFLFRALISFEHYDTVLEQALGLIKASPS